METIAKENLTNSNNNLALERIFVDIPQSDMMFFKLFADRMGWPVNNKQSLWNEYIRNSLENNNPDLSEEEIMEEVRAIRHGKV